MKPILLALVLAFSLNQAPEEPPEYPDGTFCSPQGDQVNGTQTPDHPCSCHRVVHDELCEGEPSHEAMCKQWCHEKHCHCPVTCDAEGHHQH
jgi:hypothetical protein